MSSYTVHIHKQTIPGLIGGDYAVLVIRHEFPNSAGRVVSSTTGIDGAYRAQQVAKEYRQQYGVAQ